MGVVQPDEDSGRVCHLKTLICPLQSVSPLSPDHAEPSRSIWERECIGLGREIFPDSCCLYLCI